MELEELKPEFSILRCAADELKSSAKLKTVLAVSYEYDTLGSMKLAHSNLFRQTILAIGNTLNASTFRGDAQGFQIESLLKVSRKGSVID